MKNNEKGRLALTAWQEALKANSYLLDNDFRHSVSFYCPDSFEKLDQELKAFSKVVVEEIVPLVAENNRSENLPRIVKYDGVGNSIEAIIHHPSYAKVGNLIYGTSLMERMSNKSLLEGLAFFFLSSQAGEAGHNCPIACSYGFIQVLKKMDFPKKNFYLEKLYAPSYDENYTSAQFVTEVQGGSDIGSNAVEAVLDENGKYRISGEKWFCSNADADLILMTARYDPTKEGTKGVALFLVPAVLDSGERNHYFFRRLKDKLGTRSLATAEIDFKGAFALPVGELSEGFKILMESVLTASRLFNTVSVLGMARRAYQIAQMYAQHREAFGHPIITYPLVQENLAQVKVENTALLASIFTTIKLQEHSENKLLIRTLTNLNKYLSALFTVEHIHHCLDVLAGNGTIETFSPIPLLLRDSIICENWEGTHNTLRMQILKDILRYHVDEIFLAYLEPLLQEKVLQEKCEELKRSFQELKSAPDELQSLLIKNVVDAMGMLFSAACLYQEAMDQEKNGNVSKMHCFQYFIHLHLDAKSQNLLKLIQDCS